MDERTRMEEYRALCAELEQTPPALEYTVERAKARAKSRRRRGFARLAGAVSLCAAFVLLVNTSTTFAYACGRVPLLKELAQAVALSPSLSAAVENEYVQPVELEQTAEGITARVEYLIVDQRQVNIFYTLESEVYGWMDVTPQLSGEVPPHSLMGGGGFDGETRDLRQITVDFVDEDVPGSLTLTMQVQGQADRWGAGEDGAPATRPASPFIDPEGEDKVEYAAEFVFELRFDPMFTAQGRAVVLNTPVDLGLAQMTVVGAEVYPSHFRLELTQPADSPAWVKSLDFTIRDRWGRTYEAISNGISATGSDEGDYMASHRLESPWFSGSGELTVTITGATLQTDGARVKLTLDTENPTAEGLPEGCRLVACRKYAEGWEVVFEGTYAPGSQTVEQLFYSHFWDEDGVEHSINSWGSSNVSDREGAPEDTYGVNLYLRDVPGTAVYLEPCHTHRVVLDVPAVITVPAG